MIYTKVRRSRSSGTGNDCVSCAISRRKRDRTSIWFDLDSSGAIYETGNRSCEQTVYMSLCKRARHKLSGRWLRWLYLLCIYADEWIYVKRDELERFSE
jgi:hypothetical protein